MTRRSTLPEHERLQQLLADHATQGLSVDESLELADLLHEHPEVDLDCLELATAAADVFYANTIEEEPLPSSLRDRIAADAFKYLPRTGSASSGGGSNAAPKVVALKPQIAGQSGSDSTASAQSFDAQAAVGAAGGQTWGWLLATAALIGIAALVWRFGPIAPSLDERRAEVLAAEDTIQWPWKSSGADERFAKVEGDVIWSKSLQQGFMRLRNLPVNDPESAQYQLWIVDPSRDQHPVDGGVFDISESGEAIVPIRAVLPINDPTAFALTSEQPGGVVVSGGPLLVVAAE